MDRVTGGGNLDGGLRPERGVDPGRGTPDGGSRVRLFLLLLVPLWELERLPGRSPAGNSKLSDARSNGFLPSGKREDSFSPLIRRPRIPLMGDRI